MSPRHARIHICSVSVNAANLAIGAHKETPKQRSTKTYTHSCGASFFSGIACPDPAPYRRCARLCLPQDSGDEGAGLVHVA